MIRKDILNLAIQSIVDGDEEKALEIARRAVAEKEDLMMVLNEGFSKGIREVGNLFERGENFTRTHRGGTDHGESHVGFKRSHSQ